MSDIEELRALVNALHSRGIREKGLQRQIQKYLEIIPQVCTKHKDGKCVFDTLWSLYYCCHFYFIFNALLNDSCNTAHLVAMIELHELEESQVSVESVRGWCVQEQAMEMDIAVLQQVEELERKVTAASLQVKVKEHTWGQVRYPLDILLPI